MKPQRHTVTLSFVSSAPLEPGLTLADIAYRVTTHLWPSVGSLETRSRPATREEAQALEGVQELELEPS